MFKGNTLICWKSARYSFSTGISSCLMLYQQKLNKYNKCYIPYYSQLNSSGKDKNQNYAEALILFLSEYSVSPLSVYQRNRSPHALHLKIATRHREWWWLDTLLMACHLASLLVLVLRTITQINTVGNADSVWVISTERGIDVPCSNSSRVCSGYFARMHLAKQESFFFFSFGLWAKFLGRIQNCGQGNGKLPHYLFKKIIAIHK